MLLYCLNYKETIIESKKRIFSLEKTFLNEHLHIMYKQRQGGLGLTSTGCNL